MINYPQPRFPRFPERLPHHETMKRLILGAAVAVGFSTGAQAQSWLYQTQGQGTAPGLYGNLTQMQQSAPPPYYAPSMPEVPAYRSYIPEPTRGPARYPCTIPGCR